MTKKSKKSLDTIISKPRPVNINTIEKNSKNQGILKYHPELNRLLYCYPNSNEVYYFSEDKDSLLNTHGTKVITSIDIGFRRCASASEDNTINIFSTSTINSDKSEIAVTSTPLSLQFNPNQSYLAVGFVNNIKIYYVSDTLQQNTIKDAHKGEIYSLSYNYDGSFLASVGEDSKLKIWDTDKFTEDSNGLTHTIQLDCTKDVLKKVGISWRPRSNELTFPTRSSNTIKSITLNSNKPTEPFTTRIFDDSEGHTKEVTMVQWSIGGDYLASVGLDNNLFIWDAENQNPDKIQEPIATYKHSSQIVSLSWSIPSLNSISFFDIKGHLNTYSNFVESFVEESVPSQVSIEEDPEFDFGDQMIDDNQEEITTNHKKLMKKGSSLNEDDQEESDGESGDEEGGEDNSNPKNYNQEAFQIGSTYQYVVDNPKTVNSKTKRYYMAYNMLGKITKREELVSTGESSSIEISFHEIAHHKMITFSDKDQYLRLASLGTSGAVFATRYQQSEIDDFQEKYLEQHQQSSISDLQEEDDISNNFGGAAKNSQSLIPPLPKSYIVFKSFDSLGMSKSDWSYSVDKEEIAGVVICKNYVVSCSDNRIVRVFSLGGIQLNLFSLPGDLVTMCSRDDTLVIVYHSSNAVGVNSNQFMKVWWINLSNGKQLYHDSLPLSPFSQLSWIGHSDEGLLTSMDSLGMLRQLSNGWVHTPSCGSADNNSLFQQWVPITDLARQEKNPHSTDLYTYWVIGLNKKDIYSIYCCGFPAIKVQTHNYVKIDLPLLSGTSSLNNDFLRNKFQLSSYLQINSNTATSITATDPKLFEESVATKQILEIDTAVIKLFQVFCSQGHYQKCLDLCNSLHLKKSFSIVLAISNKEKASWLSKKIVGFIENFKPFNLTQPQPQQSIVNTTTTTTSTSTPNTTQTSSVVDTNSDNSIPVEQKSITPVKTKVANKQVYDNDIYSSDDIDQSPPPKSSSSITSKPVKKVPFQSKQSSTTTIKSPESKKRKDTPTSNQPSKISKFK